MGHYNVLLTLIYLLPIQLSAYMDREQLLRRIVHMCTPFFLVYYLLPDPLWSGGPDREVALLLVLGIVLIFEAIRLIFKIDIPGMRPYERNRISAAAWAAAGMTLAFLFFPIEYAAPVFLGMGLVDPIIGELRARKSHLYPLLPGIIYFILAVSSMTVLMGFGLEVLAAGAVISAVAILIERPKIKLVDDDFLLIAVPITALWFLFRFVFDH